MDDAHLRVARAQRSVQKRDGRLHRLGHGLAVKVELEGLGEHVGRRGLRGATPRGARRPNRLASSHLFAGRQLVAGGDNRTALHVDEVAVAVARFAHDPFAEGSDVDGIAGREGHFGYGVAGMLRTITATEYVTPLREGGSLPAIVAGDDDGTYVVKFRGAGQGPRALIAELVSGELARALGLPVPEIVLAELDPRMAKTEPDPEIQDLLRNSEGLNLALDYLPGSITYDPMVEVPIADLPRIASEIVWFDALVTNVDRTAKNTNLLVWHRKLWMIDHGASLIFHHNWSGDLESAAKPFAQIGTHVLLSRAGDIAAADARLAPKLTADVIANVVELIPEEWMAGGPDRRVYRDYLMRRLQAPREWMEDAVRARTLRV